MFSQLKHLNTWLTWLYLEQLRNTRVLIILNYNSLTDWNRTPRTLWALLYYLPNANDALLPMPEMSSKIMILDHAKYDGRRVKKIRNPANVMDFAHPHYYRIIFCYIEYYFLKKIYITHVICVYIPSMINWSVLIYVSSFMLEFCILCKYNFSYLLKWIYM